MSFHPQTPQSPSHYSPGTSEPLSSINTSMTSSAGTLPTPAHSVNGSTIGADPAHDLAMGGAGDDSPQKRKRPLDDLGEQGEQKKAHVEDRRLGIENLHLDVGEKYLLCRTPHPRSSYPVTEDLFEMFGLTELAAEVARTLPNGEKNAMRKTYKGHIKKLGVNGHFDSVKKEANDPDGFQFMLLAPEQEWGVREVGSRDVTGGFSATVRQNLLAAATMAKGPIGKDRWDSSVLGDLASDKAYSKQSSAKPTTPGTPLSSTTTTGAGAAAKGQQPLPAQAAARPQRSVKKRSYGDASFEGYGEGYVDDDAMDTGGDSTGEGDSRVAGQKRRKKNAPGGQSFPAPVRQQSYGPGMVGA